MKNVLMCSLMLVVLLLICGCAAKQRTSADKIETTTLEPYAILSNSTSQPPVSSDVSLSSAAEGTAQPSTKPHTPAVGSAERKAVLDALRITIEDALDQAVEFYVKLLLVQDGYAFAQVAALTPDGKPVDYNKTQYRESIEEGFFDDSDAPVCALMRYQEGEWTVVTYVIGPTDVAFAGWWQEYGAPKAIFPCTD